MRHRRPRARRLIHRPFGLTGITGAMLMGCLMSLWGLPALASPPKAASGEPSKSAAQRAVRPAGATAAASAAALSLASEDQRHAFSLAHLGDYQCELNRRIRVLAHPRHEGYLDLHFNMRVITARPVLSSTGALRLEDVKGRYLMVQIAFKSMLLDTRVGQRVADECLHDAHHEARRHAADAPPSEGLGISGLAAEQPPMR